MSSYALVADGTYLSPTNAQLTTVSVLTPMWINFSISENEMERIRNDVRAGQLKLPEGGKFVVEVEMVDGNLFPYTGAITFADPSYNPTTGTFLLRATVNNPAGVLRPNQYVRVRLTGAIRPNAVVVPQRAVQQSAKGHFVWVVNAQNKAELRPVTVGEWKGEGWLISEGLANGDKVVVDGGVRLSAGADVKAAAYTPPATTTVAKSHARQPAYPAATPSGVHVLFDKGTVHARRGRAARHARRGGRVHRHRHAGRHHRLRRQDRQRRGQRRAREEARAEPCATSSWSSASSPGASCSRRRPTSPAAAATTRRAGSTSR